MNLFLLLFKPETSTLREFLVSIEVEPGIFVVWFIAWVLWKHLLEPISNRRS